MHARTHPQLKLLPEELNQILIITVVASMALTPALAALGAKLGDAVDALEANGSSIDEPVAPKSLEVRVQSVARWPLARWRSLSSACVFVCRRVSLVWLCWVWSPPRRVA